MNKQNIYEQPDDTVQLIDINIELHRVDDRHTIMYVDDRHTISNVESPEDNVASVTTYTARVVEWCTHDRTRIRLALTKNAQQLVDIHTESYVNEIDTHRRIRTAQRVRIAELERELAEARRPWYKKLLR